MQIHAKKYFCMKVVHAQLVHNVLHKYYVLEKKQSYLGLVRLIKCNNQPDII